jgi:hypothetical protein
LFFSTIKDNRVDPLITPTEPKRPSKGKQDVAMNSDTSADHKQPTDDKAPVFPESRKKSMN